MTLIRGRFRTVRLFSIRMTVVMTGILMVLGACSANSAMRSADATAFVGLLRETTYDYDVYSPEELRDLADAVIVAEIVDVVAGRTIEGIGAHAVMSMRVLEQIKGPVRRGEMAYVEVPTTPIATVDAYRASLPRGRVLIFLDDRSAIPSQGDRGAPAASSLYAPMPPTPIFENPNETLVAYEDFGAADAEWGRFVSLDEFVGTLKQGD